MQRILAFLVLLILPWAARGQAVADWYYWFDTDAAPREGGKVTARQFQLQTDVSNLPTGAHTLYVQVIDTAGVFSPPLATLFFKVPDASSFDKLFYFIDTEEETHSIDFGNGTFSLDVSSCTVGLHTISLQVTDKQGGVSDVMPYLFYKVPTNARLSSFRYWFDNEQTVREQPYGQGQYLLDVSELTPGLHFVNLYVNDGENNMTDVQHVGFMRLPNESNQKLHYWFDGDTITNIVNNYRDGFLVDVSRLKEGFNTIFFQMEDNGTSGICSQDFIKIPQTEGDGDMTVICVIDGKKASEQALPTNGGIIKWDMDVSSIDVGLHKAMFQIITPSGAGSSIAETYFLRTVTDAEAGTMQCSYVIDGFRHYTHKGTLANGTFHFDLPVDDMEDGLHHIDYMLVADNGVTTTQGSAWFFRTPIGGNCITQYDYWLNSKSDEIQSVTLDTPTDPFKLINLLPVTAEPIRSTCFHFQSKDELPMMHAKNDIHFRFYDKSGRWVDADNQYVDYSVGQEIKPVGELQSTQTFNKVAANDIRWYTMQAAPGDTAAFRVSQAATVQVFAPSGKEVFNTSEAASVKWNGIHTWEVGTYYVAVHDVTGSRNMMTLDYMHMDKYDVVEWDVHTVGNGGCSTITFKGNGFRDLYAVDLVIAPGDTIHSVDVGHESDAETSVTFDFTGAELGKYNAIFHFTQEDKPFANVVTVEEAVDIELATNVSFPSTFLRGTSTTYTIKITNMGNMTAYSVPIYTFVKCYSKNSITRLKYEGIDLNGMFNYSDLDSLSDEDIRDIRSSIEELGDIIHFMNFHVKDEITGDSIWIRSNSFFIDIAPYETKTLRLVINSTEEIQAYFTVPKELNSLTSFDVQMSKRIRSKGPIEHLCCYHERYECVLNVFTDVADLTSLIFTIISLCPAAAPASGTVAFASGIASCVSGALSKGSEELSIILCDNDKSLGEKLKAHLNKKPVITLAAAIWNCWGLKLKKVKGLLKAISDVTADVSIWNYTTASDCVKAWTERKPNCPPCKGSGCGGGGSSTPVPPSDPNDIYGYLSEAGSKFITDHIEKVCYTIEFENDTTFAEASAHTIVIKDTLNSRYFDLKSFLPTTIKLGSRETFLNETDVNTKSGVTSFLKTIDMRPEINAIAQVEGTYSQKTGIAEWRFTSLDPMTMEPTDDLMQGILPVNYDGTSGIGEVMYEIGVKPNKADGTEIPNRASIVFDYEEAILTPTWTNIVDATAPKSHVTNVQMASDSTATVRIAATDELSGPWRYNVYVQYGSGAWFLGAENVPVDTTATVKVYEGMNHGFYVVATDSAGNVEQKEAEREFTFEVFGSQVDTDTKLQLAQGWNWISHNQQEPLSVDALKPASIRMVGQTEEMFKDSRLGWMGDLEELMPTQMYKIQADETKTVQLSGRLFNAGFRSVPLYEGWNWLGYPAANTMSPAEALAKLEAEEGEVLIGQDGMAVYNEGQWTGTLLEMVPGQGYMYRSASDKNLFLNATAQASARKVGRLKVEDNNWAVDKRKYPSVMGIIAQLWHEDTMADSDDWLLGAFCGSECRGIATTVSGMLMMNVYGTGSETIRFYAMNRETGEVLVATEQEEFRADLLGTMNQPMQLHIGEATGISDVENGKLKKSDSVFDMMGRQIANERLLNRKLPKGVYVVTDGEQGKAQKVIRK